MTTRLRLAARLALAIGITGSVVGMSIGPAAASVSSLSVNPGTSISTNTTVSVSASSPKTGVVATGSRTLTLSIAGPDGSKYSWPSKSVSNTQDGSISGSFSTVTPPWASGGLAAANGQYTVVATDGSSTSKTVNLTLAVPPSDVTGFNGSASGSVATFTWAANSDNVPDFAGYLITSGSSSVKVAPNSGACDASSCGVSIDYGSAARGQSYSFSIVALRLKGPGSTGTVPSANAASTNVSFPAPPSPAPSTSDGSGSTDTGGTAGGGSTGGTTTGGTSDGTSGSNTGGGTTTGAGGSTTSARGAHGPVLTGKNPGADLGRYLPTLSAGAAPNLPSVITEIKPIPQGTYKPTLAYPDQTLTSSSTKKVAGSSIEAVGNDIVKVLNLRMLWTSLGGAALLLLVAAHLKAWLDGIETVD
ncbi:MAG: hypothetical protein QOC82_750 [Frankiaceae bacterium]|jgi:hypothetical protein|nr:hypothetical protein [Frankiaceae bacterium]MDQ1700548.1 hypothetical protein [Frankiaceae bacterium]